MNRKDKSANEILENTSRRIGNKWEVGLLWAEDSVLIPESRENAYRRLMLLERKLDRDPKYANLYYKEMERLFEKSYAREVDNTKRGERVWYLRHFGVQNENKPIKVRLVFDAAAKSSGVSFNDLLLTGPMLLKPLPGILMRFRQKAVAFKADMRDMFLRIGIIPADLDAQRFLWRGKDRTGPPRECVMVSLLFGAKPSPSTALYIKNKNAREFLEKYPVATKGVEDNFYMDDFLDRCDSESETVEQIEQTIKISAAANWEMHSWASNTVSDEFAFQLGESKISENLKSGLQRPTKREFLKIIISVFDPLRFLSPFTVQTGSCE